MREKAGEMATVIGPGVQVLEYGCGSIEKVRVLLDALEEPASTSPVDISREHLRAAAAENLAPTIRRSRSMRFVRIFASFDIQEEFGRAPCRILSGFDHRQF